MTNEILLILNLILIYSCVLLFYKLLGKTGLYCWTVFATIAANIEVTVVIDAFGLEQTLGNILFASTFIVTDILSETEGKKAANGAVIMGIITSACFILLSRGWLLFEPNSTDIAHGAVSTVFKNTPRFMLSSIAVYAIVQFFDVFIYHKIWDLTERLTEKKDKLLWLRNNLATIISQLLNSVLYTIAAFWGIYETKSILSIIISTFIIAIITSILDTPIIYIARKMNNKKAPL